MNLSLRFFYLFMQVEPLNCQGHSLSGPVKHLWVKHQIVDTKKELERKKEELQKPKGSKLGQIKVSDL